MKKQASGLLELTLGGNFGHILLKEHDGHNISQISCGYSTVIVDCFTKTKIVRPTRGAKWF